MIGFRPMSSTPLEAFYRICALIPLIGLSHCGFMYFFRLANYQVHRSLQSKTWSESLMTVQLPIAKLHLLYMSVSFPYKTQLHLSQPALRKDEYIHKKDWLIRFIILRGFDLLSCLNLTIQLVNEILQMVILLFTCYLDVIQGCFAIEDCGGYLLVICLSLISIFSFSFIFFHFLFPASICWLFSILLKSKFCNQCHSLHSFS